MSKKEQEETKDALEHWYALEKTMEEWSKSIAGAGLVTAIAIIFGIVVAHLLGNW